MMFDSYAVDKIRIKLFTSRDDWGTKEPDKTIEIYGYMKKKRRLIRDVTREEVVSSTIQLYIDKYRFDQMANRALSHEDRIDKVNDEELDRSIIDIDTVKSFANPDYEVFLS